MDLVVDVYELTNSFPSKEQYGLTAQMRRSVISIPSNIAEGSGRKNTKEFIQFLFIANASLSELETQLEISLRLSYSEDILTYMDKIKRIRKMIYRLNEALEKRMEIK